MARKRSSNLGFYSIILAIIGAILFFASSTESPFVLIGSIYVNIRLFGIIAVIGGIFGWLISLIPN